MFWIDTNATSKRGNMVKAGTKILNAEGYGLIFRKTAQDTNGELLEMDAFYRPRGTKPPLHFHPSQEEYFQVLSGIFQVQLADQSQVYKAGESFQVPIGVPHAMYNISDEKGHLVWQTRPALNSEGFFEAVWGMEQQESSQNGIRRLLRLAAIFQTYRREVRLVKPGQRFVLWLLAPLGRRLIKA
jgi:quercetin dioxygenase-like cupin family protein